MKEYDFFDCCVVINNPDRDKPGVQTAELTFDNKIKITGIRSIDVSMNANEMPVVTVTFHPKSVNPK